MFANFSHILHAHISKSKSCVNMKSSTNYFHIKTKKLADFQICFSVTLIHKVDFCLANALCLKNVRLTLSTCYFYITMVL